LDRFPFVSMVKINRTRVEFFSCSKAYSVLVPFFIVNSCKGQGAKGIKPALFHLHAA
jgi:hypothetical protein